VFKIVYCLCNLIGLWRQSKWGGGGGAVSLTHCILGSTLSFWKCAQFKGKRPQVVNESWMIKDKTKVMREKPAPAYNQNVLVRGRNRAFVFISCYPVCHWQGKAGQDCEPCWLLSSSWRKLKSLRNVATEYPVTFQIALQYSILPTSTDLSSCESESGVSSTAPLRDGDSWHLHHVTPSTERGPSPGSQEVPIAVVPYRCPYTYESG
jgi:hypothetical protein